MIKLTLKEMLRERNITQAEFAEMTGIRPSTICDICNNNCSFLKLENIDKICSTLNCNIENFIILVSP